MSKSKGDRYYQSQESEKDNIKKIGTNRPGEQSLRIVI